MLTIDPYFLFSTLVSGPQQNCSHQRHLTNINISDQVWELFAEMRLKMKQLLHTTSFTKWEKTVQHLKTDWIISEKIFLCKSAFKQSKTCHNQTQQSKNEAAKTTEALLASWAMVILWPIPPSKVSKGLAAEISGKTAKWRHSFMTIEEDTIMKSWVRI